MSHADLAKTIDDAFDKRDSIGPATKGAVLSMTKGLAKECGPHGVRDSWGYDMEASAFANAGYAVLKVNYRGSGGYGKDFHYKWYRHWGLEMQDDLEDGVLWAAGAGIADINRVCIYGASYGGYAALAGALSFAGRPAEAAALLQEAHAAGVDAVQGPTNGVVAGGPGVGEGPGHHRVERADQRSARGEVLECGHDISSVSRPGRRTWFRLRNRR